MTDYYGVSGRPASTELEQMTDEQCDRKIRLLQAAWQTFDETAARVSAELRQGPRGGGWEKDFIIRHVNGAEIQEFAPKVGIRVPVETRDDPSEGVPDRRLSLAAANRWRAADVR